MEFELEISLAEDCKESIPQTVMYLGTSPFLLPLTSGMVLLDLKWSMLVKFGVMRNGMKEIRFNEIWRDVFFVVLAALR